MHWRRKWQPTQCSCLENPRDRGAWWVAICGVTQSWTRLKRLSSSSSSSSSTAALQASLSITNSQRLLKFMSVELVMPSNYLFLCHPLLLLPSIFPIIRVFSNETVLLSGGQSIGVSASASAISINIQDCFPLGWTDWISLQSKGLSRVFSNPRVQKHQFFGTQLSSYANSHIRT